jgi:hypothetical protein
MVRFRNYASPTRNSSPNLYTKFIHQILPMGDIFHKIDPSQSATYSSYQLHTESEAHLLHCPQCRDTMEYFLNVTLTNFFEANPTCPELGWCLGSILSSQIRGTEPTFGTKHGRDAAQFQALLLTQHALGWDQLVQGRLAQHWSLLQEDYLDQNQHHLKFDRRFHSVDIWTRKLIALQWTTVRACWDHHNSDSHGTNKEENHAIRRGRLLVSIRALYTEAPQMLATDRDTLALPVEDRLKKSPAGRELWLLRTRNIVKLSKQTVLAALQCTHKILTSYFQPHPTQTSVKENTDRSHPT